MMYRQRKVKLATSNTPFGHGSEQSGDTMTWGRRPWLSAEVDIL